MKAFRPANERALGKPAWLHKHGGDFFMRPFIRSFYRAGVIGSTALALSFVPTNARAQQTSAQDPQNSQVAVSGRQNANANLNSDDANRMDQFLDDHKDIDKELKKDPSLVTNKKYLDHHKELRSFLQEHPSTQGEFARNPNYFTQRQDRLAAGRGRGENTPSNTQQAVNSRNQDQDRDRDSGVANSQNGNAANSNSDRDQDRERNANGQNQNPGQRTGQAAQLDQFLDSHQQIDKDLTANPSLATNNAYLDQHQDLRTFLNDHPDLREQFAKNPTSLMQRTNQFDARGTRAQNQNQDRDRNAGVANSQNGYAANNNSDRDQDRDRNTNGQNQQNGHAANNNPSRDQDRDRYANGQNQQNGHAANNNPDRDQDRDRNTNGQNQQNGYAANNNPGRDQDRDRNFTDRDQDRANGQNPNPDLRNWELARTDQFLDDHQQIDKELTAKPSLINDQKYLAQHKDLQLFLSNHPQVREEFAENPSYFMHRENRFDAREDFRSRTNANTNQNAGNARATTNANTDRDRDVANSNPDRDEDRARMDQFLDDHNDVNKDLRSKPFLVNDQKYVSHHKDLQLFLNNHPQVRQEFARNPSYFMNRDNRFDSREFGERTDANRNYSRSNSNAAPNLTDKQAKQMDQFLDKHKDIDRDLAKNPSLCNDDKYLNHHKDLRGFLDKNPQVRTQVASNSRYFTQRHERMQGHAPVKGTKPPAKTPVEQHETTTPATPH
jgi:hypothetical protein